MDFSQALIQLKAGNKIADEYWHGKNMHVILKDWDTKTFGITPIFLIIINGKAHQWHPSPKDLLSETWIVVE